VNPKAPRYLLLRSGAVVLALFKSHAAPDVTRCAARRPASRAALYVKDGNQNLKRYDASCGDQQTALSLR
jgi:hypothetical protein